MAVVAGAVPAKRGQWRTVTLADGTQVKVELRGDEHFRYYTDAAGLCYVCDGDDYHRVSRDEMTRRYGQVKARRAAKMPSRRALQNKDTSIFQGEKKGLIILVEFSNKSFAKSHDQELYDRIINERGYNEGSFVGSVRDYFNDQSYGKFDLSFDVVGPVTMPKTYAYYGKDSDGEGNDSHPGEMVATACQMIDEEVDFSRYDWDDDGVVEEVYVLYAGHGQADYHDRNTIWPHMFALSAGDYGQPLKLDDMIIDVYACSNEIQGNGNIAGVGTFCHEFSHCMGFPDMYDTGDSGNFGMGSFDLMDSGPYNGDGYCPPEYSSYERWECGWLEPVELLNDTIVENMLPVNEGGDAFIIYNKAHPDECYILENRQKTGWDQYLPGRGMLILYCDYDPILWEYNMPNSTTPYYDITNDHQRLTIFHADNKEDSGWTNTQSGDPYPANGNNIFSNTSTPAATLWHPNVDGSLYMNIEVSKITRRQDGTMSFVFKKVTDPVIPDDEGYDVLLYESFDKCQGSGGNDYKFSGSVAVDLFIPDLEGWVNEDNAMYGANKCARFGTSTKTGIVTSPAFELEGEAEVLFRAAPWGNIDSKLLLTVNGDATVSESELPLLNSQWNNFNITLTTTDDDDNGDTDGSSDQTGMPRRAPKSLSLTFSPSGRFFLDEVKVRQKKVPVVEGIREISHSVASDNRIFSLDGRYLGTNLNTLQPGIYIINGKKVVLR
ncbi:MAG: M6 family metalloprotease domain-containing protein [Prevotella sp.]|nr:M6 family metalloprotease domain-containing protein [Prevotella sp.]